MLYSLLNIAEILLKVALNTTSILNNPHQADLQPIYWKAIQLIPKGGEPYF